MRACKADYNGCQLMKQRASYNSSFNTSSQRPVEGVSRGWAQKHRENAKLVLKQVVRMYQRAMTALVDQLYIPSDELHPFIEGIFAPVAEIGDKVRIEVVEGQIPEEFPPGCYIRNGPNPRFGASQNLHSPLFGGETFYNWFEGEGMLHATYFEEDGSIWYKNKYVETESFKLETEMGRKVYLPTMDERTSPGARFNRIFNLIRYGEPNYNTGNTSVFEHAGNVVVTAEGGRAYEIDISDLSTKGEYNCNGNWNRRFFGVHPKIHPETNQLMVYGFDIVKPYYVVSLLSGDGKQLLKKIDVGLDRLILMHDVGITDKYIIIYDFPLVMDIFDMLLKGEPIISVDCTADSRIGVMPVMGDQTSIKWFNVKRACLSHHCNSYEDGDEIVIHGVVTCKLLSVSGPTDGGTDPLEWYARGMTLQSQEESELNNSCIDGKLFGHVHEWRLNLRTGEVIERNLSGDKYAIEVPRINENYTGKKYRYIYAGSEDLEASKEKGFPIFKSIVKIDITEKNKQVEVFRDAGDDSVLSEPVFVPRPGATQEDDGWIVSYVHNISTDMSDMIIIDAQTFEKQPLARLRLPQKVPFGFHGAYIKKR
ncbi:hypothetical protein R1sor_011096 [Riccia sorocarpa]|uniref:Uncharacterized protein n=1 Tax=Riccia sorocarpa TaxID=122646 RepID=A0ABD3HZW1_9MARC